MQDAWRMATQRQPEPVEATNWKCDKPVNEATLYKKDPNVMTGGT